MLNTEIESCLRKKRRRILCSVALGLLGLGGFLLAAVQPWKTSIPHSLVRMWAAQDLEWIEGQPPELDGIDIRTERHRRNLFIPFLKEYVYYADISRPSYSSDESKQVYEFSHLTYFADGRIKLFSSIYRAGDQTAFLPEETLTQMADAIIVRIARDYVERENFGIRPTEAEWAGLQARQSIGRSSAADVPVAHFRYTRDSSQGDAKGMIELELCALDGRILEIMRIDELPIHHQAGRTERIDVSR